VPARRLMIIDRRGCWGWSMPLPFLTLHNV